MGKSLLKIIGIIILLMASLVGLAQKTDKLLLKNGNQITGEIKNMKFAKLSFDMDGPGTISIKWEHVVKITSDKKFQVTMQNGDVLITRLDSSFFDQPATTLDSIIEIVRIQDKFMQRLDGSIDLGFNYAKSNSALQFNFNSSITYRKPKTELNFKLNSVITDNATDSIARKQDATMDFYRKLKKRNYINFLFGWQQNTELGLENRFILPVAAGKVLLNNNHQRLLTGAGLSYNLEESRGSTSYSSSLEGMLIISFKEFKYSTPKLSIDTRLAIFPGLSDWGRVRMGFNLSSKVEIFKDFNVGLNFYDDYDNHPPAGAASKNDYGINFTIGYEFGK
ncbi:MAG TPA: DUF481 domain-containing protein [Chitinophagaceae bacterium]|jgi:hypothetical protein|nr:DUF481 domain-containing protein [Chitinophagaceae bacterium]